MNEKIEKLGFLKGVILLFALGFFLGVGIFFGFREQLSEHTAVFYDNLIQNLSEYDVEHEELLKTVVVKEFRSFFLLLLFGISILGIPYLACFLVYKGFIGGFILGSLLVKFGARGIFLGVFYGFPQIIFYVPVFLALIHKNYYIGINGLKKKLFWEQLPSMGILLVILFIGCFFEAYLNAWILKKIFLL